MHVYVHFQENNFLLTASRVCRAGLLPKEQSVGIWLRFAFCPASQDGVTFVAVSLLLQLQSAYHNSTFCQPWLYDLLTHIQAGMLLDDYDYVITILWDLNELMPDDSRLLP